MAIVSDSALCRECSKALWEVTIFIVILVSTLPLFRLHTLELSLIPLYLSNSIFKMSGIFPAMLALVIVPCHLIITVASSPFCIYYQYLPFNMSILVIQQPKGCFEKMSNYDTLYFKSVSGSLFSAWNLKFFLTLTILHDLSLSLMAPIALLLTFTLLLAQRLSAVPQGYQVPRWVLTMWLGAGCCLCLGHSLGERHGLVCCIFKVWVFNYPITTTSWAPTQPTDLHYAGL